VPDELRFRPELLNGAYVAMEREPVSAREAHLPSCEAVTAPVPALTAVMARKADHRMPE